MGNCSSKDGFRDDGLAPLPNLTETPTSATSPKQVTSAVSPTKVAPVLNTSAPLKEWSTHDIQVWLTTLSPHLTKYGPILMGPGSKVVAWNEQVLMELGVKTAEHCQELLTHRHHLLAEINAMSTGQPLPLTVQPSLSLAGSLPSQDFGTPVVEMGDHALLSRQAPVGLQLGAADSLASAPLDFPPPTQLSRISPLKVNMALHGLQQSSSGGGQDRPVIIGRPYGVNMEMTRPRLVDIVTSTPVGLTSVDTADSVSLDPTGSIRGTITGDNCGGSAPLNIEHGMDLLRTKDNLVESTMSHMPLAGMVDSMGSRLGKCGMHVDASLDACLDDPECANGHGPAKLAPGLAGGMYVNRPCTGRKWDRTELDRVDGRAECDRSVGYGQSSVHGSNGVPPARGISPLQGMSPHSSIQGAPSGSDGASPARYQRDKMVDYRQGKVSTDNTTPGIISSEHQQAEEWANGSRERMRRMQYSLAPERANRLPPEYSNADHSRNRGMRPEDWHRGDGHLESGDHVGDRGMLPVRGDSNHRDCGGGSHNCGKDTPMWREFGPGVLSGARDLSMSRDRQSGSHCYLMPERNSQHSPSRRNRWPSPGRASRHTAGDHPDIADSFTNSNECRIAPSMRVNDQPGVGSLMRKPLSTAHVTEETPTMKPALGSVDEQWMSPTRKQSLAGDMDGSRGSRDGSVGNDHLLGSGGMGMASTDQPTSSVYPLRLTPEGDALPASGHLGSSMSDAPDSMCMPSSGMSAALQILSPGCTSGVAVQLLSILENSRQRWDEESRHVETLLRHADIMLPPPGAQLATQLRSMYSKLDLVMLNQMHYRKIHERALGVLALMCEVLCSCPLTHARWRNFASRLHDLLLAVEEYMAPVSGKSWLGVLVTGGWSSELMQGWWRQLADLGSELAGETSHISTPVDECLARFNMSCKFDDESSKMKNLISALGGIAVVMGEPKKTLELCAMLNTRKRHLKLTVNQVLQAALMMECTVESGPHSIIPNDTMRMLWYRCFPTCHTVTWPEFWKVFPQVLADLGVDMAEMEGLNTLLKDAQRRQNLQARVGSSSGGVSAFNIRAAFPKNVSLLEACATASGDSRTSQSSLHTPCRTLAGRDNDLQALMCSLVEVWHPGVLLLHGDAGQGKSSLVQELTKRLGTINFPSGGIFTADMHKATSANELAARVCAAIGAVLSSDDHTALWVALQRLSRAGAMLMVLEDVTAAAADCNQALASLVSQILSKAPNIRILMTAASNVDVPGVQIQRHLLPALHQDSAMAMLLAMVPELNKDVASRLCSICQYQPLSLSLAAAGLEHGHCSPQDVGELQNWHSGTSSHAEAGVISALLSVLPQHIVEAVTHLVIFPQEFDDRAAALVLRRDVPDTRGLLTALCARRLLKCHTPTGMYRMHPCIREVATKHLCPCGFPHPAISGFLVNCLEMLRTAGSLYRQCHCTIALQWVNQHRHNLLSLLSLLNSGVLSETLVNQVDDLAHGMEVMEALDIGNPRLFAKMWYILSIGVERVLTPTHPNLATVLSCRADVLAKMAHHVESEKLYKQAMHIISKVPGGAEAQFAAVLEKLGMLLSKQGNLDAASHHLRRALSIKQRIMGEESMEVAQSRIRLASVLSQKDGDCDEAEQLLMDGYATMVADVTAGHHHPRVIEPFTNLAASYMAQELHSEAERMYQCVLTVQEDLMDTGDPRLVATLRKLAAASTSQGKLEKAEGLYKRALQIQHNYYGKGQLENVPVMNKLAAVYSQQGDYEEAEIIFHNALSIQRSHQGEHHADLAPTLCELGDLLCKQSKWAKAELVYSEALQVLKTVSAEEKIFARVLVRQATAVEAQERLPEALALYEELVALQCKVLGENSQQVADAYQKMGGVLQAQGNTKQAQVYTQKAVGILQQLVGDTPRLAEVLKVLGMQLSANGQHEEAEQKLRHAITIETQAYGPNHLRLTDGLLRLAEVMQNLGKLNDAEEATSWVIDINLQGSTPSECNNPGIAKLYINLASIQQAQRKITDAVMSLQRALAIYDRLVARLVAQPAAWRTDELVIKIADLLSENGQYGQAEGYYRRAVSEQEATEGSDSLDLATSIFKLALAESAQSKHSDAEQKYQQALAIRQVALGMDHPDLLPVLSGLAMVRGAQGDLPSAERMYFQALEIIEAHDGMAHPDAANVLTHLHQTLESQGKTEDLGRLYLRLVPLVRATDEAGQAALTKVMASCKAYASRVLG